MAAALPHLAEARQLECTDGFAAGDAGEPSPHFSPVTRKGLRLRA